MDSSDSSSSRSQSPVSAPCTPRSPIIPKKKRARVDDEIEEMLNIQIPDSPGPQRCVLASAVRDDKYYMEDGSCVLQVENTLFNVSL